MLTGKGLDDWTFENVRGILKLIIGDTIDVVFCLIACFNGNSKLEINCKGNLNRLKKSVDDFESEVCGFVETDDGLSKTGTDLEAAYGDFRTVVGDIGVLVCDFRTGFRDLGTVVDDFGTVDGVCSLGFHDDLGSGSG